MLVLVFRINGRCFAEVNVDRFESEGDFIRASDLSSGWFRGKYNRIECGRLLQSSSNTISMNLDIQDMMNIDDPSGNIPNIALYNVRIGKLNCAGLLTSSGITGLSNLAEQPHINLDIQYIYSRINTIDPFLNMYYISINTKL